VPESAGCYPRGIELLLIVWAIAVAAVVVAVVGMGRMAWRMWRSNEEPEPGGSLSRQMFGRTKDRKPRKDTPG
jgi:hypothetical protein